MTQVILPGDQTENVASENSPNGLSTKAMRQVIENSHNIETMYLGSLLVHPCYNQYNLPATKTVVETLSHVAGTGSFAKKSFPM